MYAVIKTGGKQYKVQKDDVLEIERIEGEAGAKVSFTEVLAIADEGKIETGSPVIPNSSVEAEIVTHLRGDKIRVFKMKRRKGYRRRKGHRQELTQIRISAIKK